MFDYDETYTINLWGDGASMEVVNAAVKEIIYSLRNDGADKADLQMKHCVGKEGEDFGASLVIAFNKPATWDDKFGLDPDDEKIDPDAKLLHLMAVFEVAKNENLQLSEVDYDVDYPGSFEVYVPKMFAWF